MKKRKVLIAEAAAVVVMGGVGVFCRCYLCYQLGLAICKAIIQAHFGKFMPKTIQKAGRRSVLSCQIHREVCDQI